MELPKPVAIDRPDAVVRDLDEAHLEHALRLWENASADTPVAFSLADVLGAIAARQPALVALVDGEVAGALAARVDGERAWVLRWSVSLERRRRGIGGELLRALERRLLALGVRDISMIVPLSGEATEVARAAGYAQHDGVLYLEKRRLHTKSADDRVVELGGQWLTGDLWRSIGGMEREKELIERRVILPLAERDEAMRHGVVAASAVIMF